MKKNAECRKKSAEAAEFAFSHGAIGVMDVLDARAPITRHNLMRLPHMRIMPNHWHLQAAVSESTTP